MEVLASNISETQKLAQEIASKLKPGDVVALYGDLGSGKTTFVSMAAKALGFSARVQSPTFVISRIYQKHDYDSGIKNIHHIDLYRVQDKKEVVDLGLEEYFAQTNSIVFIEWPEAAESILPKRVIKIYFEIVDEDTRRIYVQNLY